jgi:hypothetical protein
MQRAAWFDLPSSPYLLIQEEQRGDPWRVMVACQVLFYRFPLPLLLSSFL